MSLNYRIVLPLIERAKRQPPLETENKKQAQIWRVENSVQLEAFKKSLLKYKLASWTDSSEWLQLTELALSALGFDFALLSLDFSAGKEDEVKEILSLVRPWQRHKLIVKLFLPQVVAQTVYGSSGLDVLPLTWTDEEIDQLAKWRCDETVGRLSDNRLLHIEDLFDEDLYPRFIEQAQGNPRRLVRLWRNLFEAHLRDTPRQSTFSEDNLSRAVGNLP
jgi:hypothetical protein